LLAASSAGFARAILLLGGGRKERAARRATTVGGGRRGPLRETYAPDLQAAVFKNFAHKFGWVSTAAEVIAGLGARAM
jgi:hypothetical protein